jgi:glycosyltransferase involved in cell wall biosynthesis
MSQDDFRPFVSIVIRSKDRVAHLPELLARVYAQGYEHFEVVVIDSSSAATDAQWARVAALDDPRLRVVRTPPRGCPAAANEGVRQARGEILVFIDDDDLPVGTDWLWTHVRNFRDPDCLGVNGFHVFERTHLRSGLADLGWLRRRLLLSHDLFKNPWCLAYDERRKVGIDYLMGGNASLRRSAALLGGGWDEFLDYHDEHSLFLRLHKRKPPGAYLLYDPEARMEIRKGIPGGLDARFSGDTRGRVDTLARYFLWVVGQEHPERIYGLAPLFVPYFAFLAGMAGYCLAEGRPVNRFVEALRGVAHAPAALARHLGAPRPVPAPGPALGGGGAGPGIPVSRAL